jgi:CrcB protein
MAYFWVMIGSAIGGLFRFAISRWMAAVSMQFPFGILLINVLGSFVIGYFGTLTLQSGKYPVSDNLRLFAMVGLCGGFTTFSSFSLQTFDLLRSGAWGRALANAAFSVVLCVAAVGAGHLLAQQSVGRTAQTAAIAETVEEELS